DGVGLVAADLSHLEVSPTDLAAVRLELDRPLRRNRVVLIPVVLEGSMVDDELVVEENGGPGTDLDDPERVPLADGAVGTDKGVLTGVAGAIVPESAGAPLRAHFGVARLGVVPDLDLRCATEIDATIPFGSDLEIDVELEVAVILVGRQVDALTVI